MAETIKNQNDTPEFSRIIKVSKLANTASLPFSEHPSEEEAKDMAKLFDVISVKKMRFEGEISPFGADGWLLEGKLGATVTQNCIITLATVRTRIDIDVRRNFVPMAEHDGSEIIHDISDDDETEPLGKEVDLGLIAMEALALVIPEYPRVEGAELGEADFTPPGTEPIAEEKAKPFAGLAALKEKLSNTDD